jgi:alpha-L-fucosidase
MVSTQDRPPTGSSRITRRRLLQSAIAAAPAACFASSYGAGPTRGHHIAPGPFKPTWESLRSGYATPEWFRDAKFGIWSCWGPESVPEQGDWYTRNMYLQGHPQYTHHLKTYGHPTKFGAVELNGLWKAERWQPDQLMDLFVAAGAKYFCALANHHDNFDIYNSRFHEWNCVRVGPKRDVMAGWAKAARARGLRFGVTNHSSHAWHWLQVAYDYDPEGPLAGERYDAYILTRADGRGKWWDGLNPQVLYTGRNMVMPDGFTNIKDANAWHEANDRIWNEAVPPMNPDFAENWFLRCQDLIDTYQPDLLYFDNTELPLEQYGLDIVAHYYNSSARRHGKVDVVVNAKEIKPEHTGAVTLDIERGKAEGILPLPWQTDTCIGNWYYQRSLFDGHHYKSVRSVIHSLIDIISRNGNLLLSIPLRGNGTLDEDEHAFLTALSGWMRVYGESIYGTRPFSILGEGPPDVPVTGNFNEKGQRAYTSQDIRFVTKGDALYAFAFVWPADGKLVIRTLARGSSTIKKPIQRVELLGHGAISFRQEADGLTLNLPATAPNEYAYPFVIQS